MIAGLAPIYITSNSAAVDVGVIFDLVMVFDDKSRTRGSWRTDSIKVLAVLLYLSTTLHCCCCSG